MANVVTFNTTRLLIEEIDVVAGDNELNMFEIYSEWKEFVAQTAGSPSTGSLGFPPAIRIVGGDPTSATESLGTTYFLTNGWRLKPSERNHRWTVVGNVFTDPAGQSIFVSTDGAFTVNCENKVTNLLDGIAGLTDLTLDIHGQVEREIWIDTSLAVNGNGYQQTPFNNWTDAIDYAETVNIYQLVILADATVDRQIKTFKIRGVGDPTLDINNQIFERNQLERLSITGAVGGTAGSTYRDCHVHTGVNGLRGDLISCGFEGTATLLAGATTSIIDGYSLIPGLGRPTIDVNGGGAQCSIRDWRGGLIIAGVDNAADEVTVSLAMGRLRLDATNTDGVISARGLAHFENLSAGTAVDITALLEPGDVRTTRKLAQNRTHTDPNTGIMTVFDDDDTTTFLQGNLFEDVAATQPYRGQGAERRERLT